MRIFTNQALSIMHYLGGYFLIQVKPFGWAGNPEGRIYTGSNCINDNLLQSWSYGWSDYTDEELAEATASLGVDIAHIPAIRSWANQKFNEGNIGWPHIMADPEIAREYRQTFFDHLDDVQLIALYFNEREAEDLLQEFAPRSEGFGEIGLYQALLKKRLEIDRPEELFIGYDLVGVEWSGDFHSFHCHGIGEELAEKFGLTLNQFGLFDNCEDWEPVITYLNDPETGCEPVPWFVVKVKQVAERS